MHKSYVWEVWQVGIYDVHVLWCKSGGVSITSTDLQDDPWCMSNYDGLFKGSMSMYISV